MVQNPPAALRVAEGLVTGFANLVPPGPWKVAAIAGSVGAVLGVEKFGGTVKCDECGGSASDDGCIAKYSCCKKAHDERGCTAVR